MKLVSCFFAPLVGLASLAGTAGSVDLDQLNVLYVGDPGTIRARHFAGFLKENVARVEVASRQDFRPGQAADFDVVFLDWPQSDAARQEWQRSHAPLGARESWTKPTVLLGSAGLNLAVVWKVRGGSG